MHLFIDTNIYLFCALLTKSNHEPSILRDIIELLDNNDVILIVPEVVELEFYKKLDEEFLRLKKGIKKYSKNFNSNFPSYLEEDKQKILNQINNLVELRKKSTDEAKKIFEKMTLHPNTRMVRLSEEIILNTYRRELSGLKPSSIEGNKKDINPDSLIVESIISYNKRNPIQRLIFCSDNIKDFAEFNEDKKSHDLHKDICNSFPENSILYRKLDEVLKEEFNGEVSTLKGREINDLADELQFYQIESQWNDVMSLIKRKKIQVYAMLLEGEPIKVKDNELVLQFGRDYRFHMDNIEKHSVIIEEAIKEVMNKEIHLSFILDSSIDKKRI